jgi:flagellar basal-body rod modification protein FlgD
MPIKGVGAEDSKKETARMQANALASITGSEKSSAATAASKTMGKEAFLTLLITQLQHQDPLNPADSTEFTAQLAQFSSLEQLSNVNENLNTLKLYQASINNAQAVAFIGKDIVAKGNRLEVKGGRASACEFELSAAAQRVALSIYDARGNFVADIQRTALNAGKQSLVWDGKDRNGNPVSDGAYTFEVQAEGAKGEKLGATTFSKGMVSGVTFEDGVTYLIVGGSKIAVGDVTQISQGLAATAF